MPTSDVVSKLKKHPEKFAILMGFRPLNEIQAGWLKDMVFGQGDRTLQAFRGSSKTTCVSLALALNTILRPNETTLFIRKTDADVAEVLRQVERMLNEEATKAISAMIWGAQVRVVKATQSELHTNLANGPRGTSQLKGLGIGGSLTGKHYDRIFTDDIVNVKDRTSRAERERTKLAYMELQNVRNRGGRIYNTMTPWHENDAAELMPDPVKYPYSSMPDVISAEDIAELKKRMTPSLFAANYELRHIPSDDVIFTDPKKGAAIEMVMQGECHTDAAYYGEDYTAFTALNIHDDKIYVYGRMWRKHVDDCMDAICNDVERLMLGRMFMENNADKGYSARAFRERGVRVAGYHEKQNKFMKIITYLKTAWPDIVFCEETDEGYINQICDFTEDAEHDDAADSLAALLMRSKLVKNMGQEYVSPFGD